MHLFDSLHCNLPLSLYSGLHLSVIHNQPDLLDKLLFIMCKDKKLKPVIDEQNRLYQVGLDQGSRNL